MKDWDSHEAVKQSFLGKNADGRNYFSRDRQAKLAG